MSLLTHLEHIYFLEKNMRPKAELHTVYDLYLSHMTGSCNSLREYLSLKEIRALFEKRIVKVGFGMQGEKIMLIGSPISTLC